jgi:hypothetical protein
MFAGRNPEIIGNDYLVIGTFDRPTWKQGRQTPLTIQEMVDELHDFREVLQFEPVGGWMPDH